MYQEQRPMGGTDGDPEPREKEIEYKLIPVPCPFGLDKIHCPSCAFVKGGLCDYPNAIFRGEHFEGKIRVKWATLEDLAKVRDQAKLRCDSIFTEIQILSSLPKRVV